MKLSDFLVEQVHVAGCSTLLLTEVWRHLRRSAVTAQLLGRDTTAVETQDFLLACLMPPSTPVPRAVAVDSSRASIISLVARALAKESLVFVKASAHPSDGGPVSLLKTAGTVLESQGPWNPSGMVATAFRPLRLSESPLMVLVLLLVWIVPNIVLSFVWQTPQKIVPAQAEIDLQYMIQYSMPPIIILVLLGSALVWMQESIFCLSRSQATQVFLVLACLPTVAVWMSVRSLLLIWDGVSATRRFLVLLECYNFSIGFYHWLADRHYASSALSQPFDSDEAMDDSCEGDTTVQRAFRRLWQRLVKLPAIFRLGVQGLLLFSLLAEGALGSGLDLRALQWGVLIERPAEQQQRFSTRMLSMLLVSSWARAHLLELIRQRVVVLRLLQAPGELLPGLQLRLDGGFAVIQQRRILEFLQHVTPTTDWCGMVLLVRRVGGAFGLVVPSLLHALTRARFSERMKPETLMIVAVTAGMFLGHWLSQSSILDPGESEHLRSDHRVLLLLPHLTSSSRKKAATDIKLGAGRSLGETLTSWTPLTATNRALAWPFHASKTES